MKPCSKYRERVALLAMGELEVPEPELRAHLDDCAGCRSYFGEISSVAGSLRAAEPQSNVHPSASFHRDVVAAMTRENRRSALEIFLTQVWSRWDSRMYVPVAAAAALVVIVWLIATPGTRSPQPIQLASRTVATARVNTNIAPTLMNYEMAANQS